MIVVKTTFLLVDYVSHAVTISVRHIKLDWLPRGKLENCKNKRVECGAWESGSNVYLLPTLTSATEALIFYY